MITSTIAQGPRDRRSTRSRKRRDECPASSRSDAAARRIERAAAERACGGARCRTRRCARARARGAPMRVPTLLQDDRSTTTASRSAWSSPTRSSTRVRPPMAAYECTYDGGRRRCSMSRRHRRTRRRGAARSAASASYERGDVDGRSRAAPRSRSITRTRRRSRTTTRWRCTPPSRGGTATSSTFYESTQGITSVRNTRRADFGMPPENVRVVSLLHRRRVRQQGRRVVARDARRDGGARGRIGR